MRKINASTLVLISLLLSFAIMYTYGYSMTIVYGAIEIIIAMFCYMGYVLRFKRIDPNLRIWSLLVISVAWVTGTFTSIFNGGLKSTLLITVPLIMPLYISTFNIKYKERLDFIPVSIVAVILTFLAIMRNTFGQFNSNSMGFMGFMGISFGFIWAKKTRAKIIPLLFILFGIWCAAMSGSRNVAIVSFVCIIILFIPEAIISNRTVYFLVTIIILIYTIFSADIMAWGFSVPEINNFLVEFTSNYSQKAWEMESRVDYLIMVKESILQRNILFQLFGTGSLTMHGHNMFYQCVLEYGYFGTLFIYLIFFRIFKLAYILIRKQHDNIVLGCVIALWGIFMLQGADVFLLGPETYAIVPQVFMGIILQRYATYRVEIADACRGK